MSLIDRLNPLSWLRFPSCPVPTDLESVTVRGDEVAPESVEATTEEIEGLWNIVEEIYRCGTHPALQLCIRRCGAVVIDRAIGYASGNGPNDTPETPKRLIGLDTPIDIFSASKAVTAMLVHKLASRDILHLDDWVSDYIPEFSRHGKERISIRHVLAHRAGIPNLPPGSVDLDLLSNPDQVLEVLCDAKLQSRPGRMLAYHAVTGGFILGAVIERVTQKSLRDLIRTEISEPLGLRWLNYGVAPEHISELAVNEFTGPPVPPPLSTMLKRVLGVDLQTVVEYSNDPRYQTGVLPSANIMTTAREMSIFFQCLLDGGLWNGEQIFDRRCIRHAVAEQSWWEIDLSLIIPIRYGLGFMLGGKSFGPFGKDNEHAFGHVGLSNIFCWADPERKISVALLNTGKPIAASHVIPLLKFLNTTGTAFSKIDPDD